MIIKRTAYIFMSIVIALLMIQSCMTFRKSDKKLTKSFKKAGVNFDIKNITVNNVNCRYLRSNNGKSNQPLIIFTHGAPGSSADFKNFLMDDELLNVANLISVDRMGYGYSNYGKSEISIKKQAELLHQIIKTENNKNVMVVGHSYGGPISARLVIDYPTDVKALVMLAPANDPEKEKIFWYAYFGKWKATRWMISKPLCVSADEKFSHAAQLKEMENYWNNIKTPTLHIHGNKDGLVSYDNLDFSKKNMDHNILTTKTFDKAGHLVIWKNFEETRNEVLAFFKKNVL